MDKIYIYTLNCPKTGVVKYVGKAMNMSNRLSGHIFDSNRKKTPVSLWIKSLISEGLKPKMILLDTCDLSNWEQVEVKWIRHFKDAGFDILNVAKGGNEPFCPTEVRAKNGRENAQKIHSSIERKTLWALKKRSADLLMWFKKNGEKEKYNKLLTAMHYTASKKPQLFASFLKHEFI